MNVSSNESTLNSQYVVVHISMLYTVVIVLDDSRIPKGDSWPEEAEEKTC